jgi:hypothetical protein
MKAPKRDRASVGPACSPDRNARPSHWKARMRSRAPEETGEPWVASEGLEVGVATEVAQMAIAEPDGPLKGVERLVGHAEQGVTTTKVVPGHRPIAPEPDNLEVGLKRAVVEPTGREVVGVDPEHIGVERITGEDAGKEIELEVELMLITEASRRGFRRGAISEGVVGMLRQGHG